MTPVPNGLDKKATLNYLRSFAAALHDRGNRDGAAFVTQATDELAGGLFDLYTNAASTTEVK